MRGGVDHYHQKTNRLCLFCARANAFPNLSHTRNHSLQVIIAVLDIAGAG